MLSNPRLLRNASGASGRHAGGAVDGVVGAGGRAVGAVALVAPVAVGYFAVLQNVLSRGGARRGRPARKGNSCGPLKALR